MPKAGGFSEKEVVVLIAKIGKIIPFLVLVRCTQNLRRSAQKLFGRRLIFNVSLCKSTQVYVKPRDFT